mgnify:CR=1 FL=1
MGVFLKKIIIENFKSYGKKAEIEVSELICFFGGQ